MYLVAFLVGATTHSFPVRIALPHLRRSPPINTACWNVAPLRSQHSEAMECRST